MNLDRLGHYFTPRGAGDGTVTGGCQTALVCGPADVADEIASDADPIFVNLHVWRVDGVDLGSRENVPVTVPAEGSDSFHLTADCPWHR